MALLSGNVTSLPVYEKFVCEMVEYDGGGDGDGGGAGGEGGSAGGGETRNDGTMGGGSDGGGVAGGTMVLVTVSENLAMHAFGCAVPIEEDVGSNATDPQVQSAMPLSYVSLVDDHDLHTEHAFEPPFDASIDKVTPAIVADSVGEPIDVPYAVRVKEVTLPL